MIQKIEFLNAEYVGQTGTMEVDDQTHEVVAVRFDSGEVVPDLPPYSYRTVPNA